MPNYLTITLSLTLLTLIAGCPKPEPPPASPSSESNKPPLNPSPIAKQIFPLTVPPGHPDPAANARVLQYIKLLAGQRLPTETQGIWMQSGDTLLANHLGTVPLPAASLTKVATSLAALETFGSEHQFVTLIGTTQPIHNGVLSGDLVIVGGEDPLFVWEEAIVVGNLLNQIGIQRVSGHLVIVGKFYMNFQTNPQRAGNLLKIGLDSHRWSAEVENQYQTLPRGTPRPHVVIDGSVKVLPSTPSNLQPLVRHYSLPLTGLLKMMNRYSNNAMAEMLANAVGGPKVVAQKATQATGIPATEIQLLNGSGLAIENRISPRAVCAMFRAIEEYLRPHSMTIADVFTIVGQDKGILDKRPLPPLAVVKSGSLNSVSALAGALPTQKQGIVWFAIMNSGGSLTGFRSQQETLLQSFLTQWGTVPVAPPELTPNPVSDSQSSKNEIMPH